MRGDAQALGEILQAFDAVVRRVSSPRRKIAGDRLRLGETPDEQRADIFRLLQPRQKIMLHAGEKGEPRQIFRLHFFISLSNGRRLKSEMRSSTGSVHS